MQVVDAVEKWYSVMVNPYGFYSTINAEERGQKNGLVFFVLVTLVARVPTFYEGNANMFKFAVLTAVLLLVSPALLHIITGIQYLALWLVTDEDRGVDRTLRAVAYSTAPAVVAWIPGVGIVALYGVYLQYVGIREGHKIGRVRAAVAVAVPAVLLYSVGYLGYENARFVLRVGRELL
ncbi:MAG: YIP1 family protein [Halobacteria archaeon]|nr:YIP1 family protein [Halobacteria archaeon]